MRRDDILAILCKLQYCVSEFNFVKTSFRCEFSKTCYEVNFERDNDKIIHFEIKDMGAVKNENT